MVFNFKKKMRKVSLGEKRIEILSKLLRRYCNAEEKNHLSPYLVRVGVFQAVKVRLRLVHPEPLAPSSECQQWAVRLAAAGSLWGLCPPDINSTQLNDNNNY